VCYLCARFRQEVFYGPEGRVTHFTRHTHFAGSNSLGRDPQFGTRKYHKMTAHGGLREAQSYLNRKLQERNRPQHLVAKIGGYLGRNNDLPPDHQLIWQGYGEHIGGLALAAVSGSRRPAIGSKFAKKSRAASQSLDGIRESFRLDAIRKATVLD